MKPEIKSYSLIVISFIAGIMLGMLYQQQTDEHKLIMAEWKKITSLNSLIDIKLQTSIEDYKKAPKK